MKKLIEDNKKTALENLAGQVVTLFCCRYFYTGKLVGISDTEVELKNPSIVYETGRFDEKAWKDAQKLPHENWFVKLDSVESYGIMK